MRTYVLINNIFCIYRTTAPASVVKEVQTSTSEEEDSYYVEEILDKRSIDGKKFYLLKWEGYPVEFNTWEPLENLNCRHLLNKFRKKRKNNRKKLKQIKQMKKVERAHKRAQSNVTLANSASDNPGLNASCSNVSQPKDNKFVEKSVYKNWVDNIDNGKPDHNGEENKEEKCSNKNKITPIVPRKKWMERYWKDTRKMMFKFTKDKKKF